VARRRSEALETLGVERIGIKNAFLGDLYHRLIEVTWLELVLFLAVAFAAANAVFATAYWFAGDVIANARHDSWRDAFFFSVQTMATIGYGQLSPSGDAASTIAAVEAFVGLLGLAVATGLIFAKFSRPRARVLFSEVAVITVRDGKRSLLFRLANERDSNIVDASVHVTLVRNETTVEGERLRRIYDLKIVRDRNPLFLLTWTVVHPIDESSPLHGETPASLAEKDTIFVVSMTGLDDLLSQTVHARHIYAAGAIAWNARFADILSPSVNGRRRLDFARFHDVLPLE
jgi:inward rectifier potassium channel